MIVDTKVKREVIEAKYLFQENTFRYRTIIRIAYKQYEKMKYWLYKEEIYEEIKKDEDFKYYTLDNLKQDLDTLESWGNFLIMQDTRKTRTIEEFKNRQFRYQISPYTIEFERMLIKLENTKENTRGSLETSLLESFKEILVKINDLSRLDHKELFSWWQQVNNNFKYLNESYQDYIGKFYSPKTEELLKTSQFLIFKEAFISYLRDFIKGLQIYAVEIRKIFESVSDEIIKDSIRKICEYEKMNISLDEDYNLEESFDINFGRYLSIKEWFVGTIGIPSMCDQLLDSTNEIIRKITRYALQIAEMKHLGGSRKEEYKKILGFFCECSNIEEAHKLSAMVFGVFNPRHIKGQVNRETESINSSIFEEKPSSFVVRPSNRGYREKTASRVPVKDKGEEKKFKMEEILKKREKERALVESHIEKGRLIFRNLKHISREERMVFLTWLSKALTSKMEWVKNDYGNLYRVRKNSNEDITIICEDGDFIMPDYELVFKEEV